MTHGAEHKVLVHALLCDPDGPCSRADCNEDVQKMKDVLKRMETHTAECTIGANLPGRRGGCSRCKKWLQLTKLRDRFRKALLQKQRQDLQTTWASAARRKPAEPKGTAVPPLRRRSVTYVMSSFEEEGDGDELSLLPQLVEGEVAVQRKRRDAKQGSSGGGSSLRGAPSLTCEPAGGFRLPGTAQDEEEEEEDDDEDVVQICGMDGCTKPAWHAGVCLVELCGSRSRKRPQGMDGAAVCLPASAADTGGGAKGKGKAAAEEKDDEAAGKGGAKGKRKAAAAEEEDEAAGKGASGGAKKGKAGEAAGGCVSKPGQRKQPAGAADEAEEAAIERMIVSGARLAQTPNVKGTLAGRQWAKAAAPSSGRGGGGGAAASASGKMTEDEFPPSVGMHIAVDGSRSISATLPDAWSAIETAAPPERSNVATVSEMHADGRCDAKLVCNCAADANSGAKCTKKCGAGALIVGLAPSQRQIVCSGCKCANRPHALPRLRCAACDHLIAAGDEYKRAPPVGDSHEDVVLCSGCHGKLFSGYLPRQRSNPHDECRALATPALEPTTSAELSPRQRSNPRRVQSSR